MVCFFDPLDSPFDFFRDTTDWVVDLGTLHGVALFLCTQNIGNLIDDCLKSRSQKKISLKLLPGKREIANKPDSTLTVGYT